MTEGLTGDIEALKGDRRRVDGEREGESSCGSQLEYILVLL